MKNANFLRALYKGMLPGSYGWTLSFKEPPDSESDETKPNWSGRPVTDVEKIRDYEDLNNYCCVSTFMPDGKNKKYRRKDNFSAMHALMIDDIGTKVDLKDIKVEFSALIETSKGNFQGWLFLDQPITDRKLAELLISRWIAKGWAKDSKDPGMKGVTRYARMPTGMNNKLAYPSPFKQVTLQINLDRRYSLEEIVEKFGLDLTPEPIRVVKPATESDLLIANQTLERLDSLGMVKGIKDHVWHKITCPWISEHSDEIDNGTYYAIPTFENEWKGGFKCHHGHCTHRNLRDLLSFINTEEDPSLGFSEVVDSDTGEIKRLQPPDFYDPTERMLIQKGTEHSVALAFVNKYNGLVKYDHHVGKWLQWNDRYWELQSMGLIKHYCRLMASSLADSTKTQRSSFVRGVEEFSKNDPKIATQSICFDPDNYLLNTPGGTYDLRTGICTPNNPIDMISNITSCNPGDGYGFRFPQFLKEITCQDEELEEFLQVSLGATLSGALENHWLMFWIGNGRNGKNTLGDAVMRVMGTYARKIPSSVLMKTRNDAHPTEIANLKGCRLAIASEVDQSAFWQETKLNELTGDAKLSARFMRGDFFTFDRTHKFLIYGNHRPRLSSINQAIRSRIKMVRFGADFSSNGDPLLPAKLKEEDPNILRWLIDGHLKWVKNNRQLPKCLAVEAEMDSYIEVQATVDNWIKECISPTPSTWTTAETLYESYKCWKQSRGEFPSSMVVWSESMKKFQKKRTAKGYMYDAKLKTGR
jgi:putative DNA primase/helicase